MYLRVRIPAPSDLRGRCCAPACQRRTHGIVQPHTVDHVDNQQTRPACNAGAAARHTFAIKVHVNVKVLCFEDD